MPLYFKDQEVQLVHYNYWISRKFFDLDIAERPITPESIVLYIQNRDGATCNITNTNRFRLQNGKEVNLRWVDIKIIPNYFKKLVWRH